MVSFRQNAVPSMTNPPTIALSFLLFSQILFIIRVTSYDPVDNFTVSCGSSGESFSLDHRKWTGDTGSKVFSPSEPNNAHPSFTAKATGMTKIPYDTARLSRFEFTYSFPVTDGQKFIRLYFFPFSYPDFPRSDSLFSVKAGSHTLLKDFNASLTADNDDDDTEEILLQEYCVNVEAGQRLNVTFMPSTSHPNAYAFVNGIEVVSMPTYLYYTNPENLDGMHLDGGTQQFPVTNSSALETAYRINVAGKQIPSADDTGMFRNWDIDNPYLESAERPRSVSSGFALKPIYKDAQTQNYTAPDGVYLTARNYGMNETSEYNVTWEFTVDSQFTYMVRLHFCEFEQEIQSEGDRVFQIFIADTLVEPHADVIMWSQENLVPVHRDYAVSMPSEGSSKKVNLSIKLRPHPYAKSVYHDVILNGIEVLKISDSSDNLGGPNPDPRPAPLLPFMPSTKSSKNSNKARVISIVVGGALGFLVLSLIVLLIFRRWTRPPVNERNSGWGQKSIATSKTSKKYGASLPSRLCRCFSIAEIRAATNNFDDIFIVGVGGFGNVYKGYIDDGTVPVAIKRLKPGSQQGVHEFQTEIEMLSQLRHLHLVSLIGYCNDGNEMILVYEFMARGTLRDHLYDSDNQPLSWKQRLEMCLGAARGLHHLHTGANHSIIHRDVKTTNILIDEKWVAKVSDFGLSKVGPIGMSKSHVSTVVKGSVGYLDPEYYKRQRLTQKSDVYSFGVVLLEVLCGRPPLLRSVEKQKASLVEWIRRCHGNGEIYQTVDPLLRESITPECLKAFSDMALKCLVDDGNERPSMSDVVWGLEFALELQQSTEEMGHGGTQIVGKSEERALLKEGSKWEESKVDFTSGDGTGTESTGTMVTWSSTEEEQSLVSQRQV